MISPSALHILAFTSGLLASPWGLIGQEISLPLGTQAPQAHLQDLDGSPVQILDYAEPGKPTLIEFWASWCGNCRRLQPQLDRIQTDWGARINIVAVAVAVSQTQDQVKKHVEEKDIGYTYLWDADGEVVNAYEIGGTGIVVILDAAGKVAYTGSGGAQNLVGEVQKLLEG
ncbi:MAG: TlpA disulfide reductase family protein [Gemmatimonadota bacterium]|jgi:thiol-disulfide isomerase/thioredoxin